MTYIAIDLEVLHSDMTKKSYTISINNGINEYTTYLYNLLVRYISTDFSLTIKETEEVQTFLLCAGYGLSNCIILKASEMYEAEL